MAATVAEFLELRFEHRRVGVPCGCGGIEIGKIPPIFGSFSGGGGKTQAKKSNGKDRSLVHHVSLEASTKQWRDYATNREKIAIRFGDENLLCRSSRANQDEANEIKRDEFFFDSLFD